MSSHEEVCAPIDANELKSPEAVELEADDVATAIETSQDNEEVSTAKEMSQDETDPPAEKDQSVATAEEMGETDPPVEKIPSVATAEELSQSELAVDLPCDKEDVSTAGEPSHDASSDDVSTAIEELQDDANNVSVAATYGMSQRDESVGDSTSVSTAIEGTDSVDLLSEQLATLNTNDAKDDESSTATAQGISVGDLTNKGAGDVVGENKNRSITSDQTKSPFSKKKASDAQDNTSFFGKIVGTVRSLLGRN